MINNTFEVFENDENPKSNIENYYFIEKENKITEHEGELDVSIFEFNRIYNNDTDLLFGNLKGAKVDFSNKITNKRKLDISSKRHTKVSNTRTSITARCLSAFNVIFLNI